MTVSRLRDDLQHANEKELLLLEAYETLEGDVGKQVSTCAGRRSAASSTVHSRCNTEGASPNSSGFKDHIVAGIASAGGRSEQTAKASWLQTVLCYSVARQAFLLQIKLVICCRWTRPWPGRLSSWSKQLSRRALQRRS